MTSSGILCLFDMDGTLTKPRQAIDEGTYDFLQKEVRNVCSLGLVGGSDFEKIAEQMRGTDVINKFDYVFAENGLTYYKKGAKMAGQTLVEHVGEEQLQDFINFVLKYLSGVKLPLKRGTFVEFRAGMLNISPIGRNCCQTERDAFELYDKKHGIREKMIAAIREEFPKLEFTYSIGGQISFDVFPKGWDKTYCLGHLQNEGFTQIHFFGDKTSKGGNDYELYHDPRVVGHSVTSPQDTISQLKQILEIK